MPHFELPGVSLYYEDTGGAGEPLLLLPGLATDSSCWAGCAARFGDRFRLIMPDPRGVGRTRVHAAEPFTLRTIAADCAALLKELKINRAHVLGHSMGGMVALELALDYPNLVQKLVLAGTGSYFTPYAHAVVQTWARVRGHDDPEAFFLAVLPWMVTPRYYDDPRRPDNALRYFASYPYKAGLADFNAQLAAISGFDRSEQVSRLEAPVLVIAGEYDLLFPPEQQRRLAQAIGDAQLRLLPGTAHSPLLENTAAFSVMVADFLIGG